MSGPKLLMEARPKARKHHRCYDCAGWIVPGEVHLRVNLVFDGSAYTLRQHQDCAAMSNENVSNNYVYDFFEGIPALREDEGIMEQLDLWRGSYPHVVCRIEFHEQMAELRNQARMDAWRAEKGKKE